MTAAARAFGPAQAAIGARDVEVRRCLLEAEPNAFHDAVDDDVRAARSNDDDASDAGSGRPRDPDAA